MGKTIRSHVRTAYIVSPLKAKKSDISLSSISAGRKYIAGDENTQGHANRPKGEPCVFPSSAFCWTLPSEKAAFCAPEATQRAIDSTTRISETQSNRSLHCLFKTVVCYSSFRGDNSARRCKFRLQSAAYCRPRPLILYYRFPAGGGFPILCAWFGR